jgi:hypothetical protein
VDARLFAVGSVRELINNLAISQVICGCVERLQCMHVRILGNSERGGWSPCVCACVQLAADAFIGRRGFFCWRRANRTFDICHGRHQLPSRAHRPIARSSSFLRLPPTMTRNGEIACDDPLTVYLGGPRTCRRRRLSRVRTSGTCRTSGLVDQRIVDR